jgi:hypothetical protein
MADSPIKLRTKQQILGSMISKLKQKTDITDLYDGAVNLTVLEAAAGSDLIIESKFLKLLNLNNADKLSGVELVRYAQRRGLKPVKIGASPASVKLTIGESAFSKISSTIYAGANNPVAGDSQLLVLDASSFNASGTIHVGRNTSTYEAVSYASKTNSGQGYWTLALSTPLAKDHLVGEEVVLSQGGNRPISANQQVRVPATSSTPEILFRIQNSTTLLDGEDTLQNVSAVCTTPGSLGNVSSRRIKEFVSAPWSTATAINPNPAVGGVDTETDPELRQRIKDFEHTLARGTNRALERAVIGITDPDEGKRIVTAYLMPPTKPGQYTVLFIDDGLGLEPSFSGIGQEILVSQATGTEDSFQSQQYPLVKSQLVSINSEPFNLSGGETLAFLVDNQKEQQTLPVGSFKIPGQATAQEIAQAINGVFTTIEARAKGGLLFVTPTADDPDFVQSTAVSNGTDANTYIAFPQTRAYTIRLYQDGKLLSKNGVQAIVTSKPSSQWSGLGTSGTLQLQVDGITGPTTTIQDSNFLNYSSSATMAAASVSDWAKVLNAMFIGITATANADGTFSIASNKGKSSKAQISVLGGTLASILFTLPATATGTDPQYSLNRLTGLIALAGKATAGSQYSIGTAATQGFCDSTATNTFSLPTVGGLASQIVLVPGETATIVQLAQLGSLTFSVSGGYQKIQSDQSGYFSNVQTYDWIHLFNFSRNALLQVQSVDPSGNFVLCFDPNPQTGGPATVTPGTNTISCFRSFGRPQLVTLPTGASVTAAQLVTSINSQVQSCVASILPSGAVRIQTSRYLGTGALSIPVVTPSANSGIGWTPGSYASNDPQVAAIESADLAGLPNQRLTINTPDVSAPYDVLSTNQTLFSDTQYSNRGILGYVGASTKSFRQPQSRTNSSTLLLRDDVPAPWVEIGQDSHFTTTGNVQLGEADNQIFLIDNDSTKRTFDIPMYLECTIAGPSSPTTTQWDAQDSTGALLGSSTRWLNHRFADYRAWFRARASITNPAANSAVRIRANHFGPNGKTIRFGYFYPLAPSQPFSCTTAIDTTNDFLNCKAFLVSGAAVSLGTAGGQKTYIDVSGAGPYTYKIQFSDPVNLSGVDTVNCVAYPSGTMFSAANQNPFKVTTISNLRDSSKTFSSSGSTITISSAPSFTIAINDVIQAGGYTMRITAVASQTSVTVDTTPSPVLSSATGTVSRIYVQGTRWQNGTTESQTLVNGTDVQIYPVTQQAASVMIQNLNQTLQSNSVVTAMTAPSNDGTGLITISTEDQLANGSQYVALQNGGMHVASSANASPAITLKDALDVAPEIGETVRLIPATVQNCLDHMSKKQITGLTIAADLAIVAGGRKLQVSTKTLGGIGQVLAVGGKASGNQQFPVYNTATAASSTRGTLEVDASLLSQLSPNQTIKIQQTGRVQKLWPASTPTSSDTIALAASGGTITATLTQAFVSNYAFAPSTSTTWTVRKLSRGRVRYELLSGTASIPGGLLENDWVLVGNGTTSYAGTTPAAFSVAANQGWFQIRETDNSTYFDVDNTSGVDDMPGMTNGSPAFIFTRYHSARPGDQIVFGAGTPVGSSNQGTFTITAVPSTTSVQFTNGSGTALSATALGTSGVSDLKVLDQGYQTYRKVILIAPKPQDPANRAIIEVSPGTDMGLISANQSATVQLQNRLNFPQTAVNGINGYSYWIGAKRTAQRVVDGYAPDLDAFEGQKASGTFIEARESQLQRVKLSFHIKTKDGVTLNSIQDDLKSRLVGFINSLGMGGDIVMLDLYDIIKGVPGVESAVLVTPAPSTAIIPVSSRARAKITVDDISFV